MVKLFDEFNKLTSYDQEEINISSFFIHHPISSDFIPTAFNHRPVRHVPSLYPYSISPSSVEHQYIAINYIIKNNYYFNRNVQTINRIIWWMERRLLHIHDVWHNPLWSRRRFILEQILHQGIHNEQLQLTRSETHIHTTPLINQQV